MAIWVELSMVLTTDNGLYVDTKMSLFHTTALFGGEMAWPILMYTKTAIVFYESTTLHHID